MNTKKVIKYSIIALVVLLIVVIIGKNAGFIGKDYVKEVAVSKVEKRTIVETITANGKIQPETEIKISPDVSGEIVELNIVEGQEVEKNQLLLKIRPDVYVSALDRMKASLNSAKANLENSKARATQVKAQFVSTKLNYERNKALYEKNVISQSEFENIEAQYNMGQADVDAAEQSVKAAEFQVKSAEASLAEAEENLEKTSIFAPMTGTVSMLNVEQGERVVGTMQMAGTEMARIANLNIMEVRVDVNENDIVRVSLGDTAIIEVDAYLDEEFKGIVTEIANSAGTTGLAADQVTSFEVKIRILHDSYKHLIPEGKENYYPFRPGMSATVDIMTKTRADVLSVPIQAVTTRADTSVKKNNLVVDEDIDDLMEVVFIYKEGKAEMQEVETGIQDNNYIEIIEGVSDSMEVISAPYYTVSKKLKDKDEVRVVSEDALFKKEE